MKEVRLVQYQHRVFDLRGWSTIRQLVLYIAMCYKKCYECTISIASSLSSTAGFWMRVE
jgi:hypothetical protein